MFKQLYCEWMSHPSSCEPSAAVGMVSTNVPIRLFERSTFSWLWVPNKEWQRKSNKLLFIHSAHSPSGPFTWFSMTAVYFEDSENLGHHTFYSFSQPSHMFTLLRVLIKWSGNMNPVIKATHNLLRNSEIHFK